jgi:hypothetical protein
MNDTLRYTFVVDTEHFGSTFSSIRDALRENGYEITKIKNTLQYSDVMYRGINTTVTGEDGYKFEIQFHTAQSLKVKDSNHKLYEEYRLDGTPEKRAFKLEQMMVKNSNGIRLPKGVENVR